MKLKGRIKDRRLVVNLKTSRREVVDVLELERFSRLGLSGFLSPKLKKKNLVEYIGPAGIVLDERLKKPMGKRDFFFIIEQIVVVVEKLQKNNLSVSNLVMSLQHVYINEATKEIRFIYIPTSKGLQCLNLMEFIERVAYSVIPADEEDSDFASRFIYFFKSMQQLDLKKIELFIAKEDKSIVDTIRQRSAGQSGFITNDILHYHEEKEKDDVKTDLLEEEEATGLLVERDVCRGTSNLSDEATSLLREDVEEATGLLIDEPTDYDDSSQDEGTALLSKESSPIRFPTLVRTLTNERISVDKPVFRLGKENSYSDYFIASNPAVSRNHADIITRGDKYFVKDLNSKNRTFINDIPLVVKMETEIVDGDKLTLANEEFFFYV